MNKLLLFILLVAAAPLFGQNNGFTIQKTLKWADKPSEMFAPGGEALEIWEFENCSHSGTAPTLPLFNERFPLNGNGTLTVTVTSAEWEPVTLKNHPDNAVIGNNPVPVGTVEQERLRFFGRVTMIPLRRTAAGGYERAKSFTLAVAFTPKSAPLTTAAVKERGANSSKLSDGDIYKFGVSQTAVYKLDRDFLTKKNWALPTSIRSIPERFRCWVTAVTCCPSKIIPRDLMTSSKTACLLAVKAMENLIRATISCYMPPAHRLW